MAAVPALAAVAAVAAWLLLIPTPTVVGTIRSVRARSAPLLLVEATGPTGARRPPARVAGPALAVAGLPPVVRQATPISCGAAALATLLAWRGRPVTEGAILDQADLRADGLTLGEFARLADTFGLPGAWYRTPPGGLDRLPVPFVAHLDREGGHYVVVRARTRDHVLVADPSRGWVAIDRERFLRAYRGRAFLPDRGSADAKRVGGPA